MQSQLIQVYFKKNLGVRIDENSILFKDLGIYGDDADFFMMEFAVEFNIDMSDFRFSDYFLHETIIPFGYWYYKYFDKKFGKKIEFGLDHLVEVVKKGKWFDPSQISP